jgi:hypothetical protein
MGNRVVFLGPIFKELPGTMCRLTRSTQVDGPLVLNANAKNAATARNTNATT